MQLRVLLLVASVAGSFGLAACSPKDNEPPAPKLFEGQRDALDKAKAVDAELQKRNEAQQKAMEQQPE